MRYTTRNSFLNLTCIILCQGNLFCQKITDTENLYNILLTNYNKNIRGNIDQSQSTQLGFIFHATNLISFDELTATLSMSGYFTVVWKDERMRWNITENNGIESITFCMDDVWIPMVALSNSQNEEENVYLGNDKLLVRYTSDGTAYWYPGALFKSFCRPDVKDYPFDKLVIYSLKLISMYNAILIVISGNQLQAIDLVLAISLLKLHSLHPCIERVTFGR